MNRNEHQQPEPGGALAPAVDDPRIIEALDVVPRQVMIETIIAEVSLDTDQKLGFNLSGTLYRLFHSNTTGQGALNLPANGFGSVFCFLLVRFMTSSLTNVQSQHRV